MLLLLVAALLLLFAGATFLEAPLNPREHPLGFILFWVACGWLTLTALLLAVFDMLMLKLEGRRTQSVLRHNLEAKTSNTQRPTSNAQ